MVFFPPILMGVPSLLSEEQPASEDLQGAHHHSKWNSGSTVKQTMPSLASDCYQHDAEPG